MTISREDANYLDKLVSRSDAQFIEDLKQRTDAKGRELLAIATNPASFNIYKADASTGVFFARQLELIEATMYRVKYAAIELDALLPNRQQVPAGVEKVTRRLLDKRGAAVKMAGSENGVPVVGLSAAEENYSMLSWVLGYEYNVEEIEAAQYAGFPLDAEKALAVRRGLDEALQSAALAGNSASDVSGLFSNSSATTVTIANDGTSSSKLWSAKTADLITRDLFAIADAAPNATYELENPSLMVMSHSRLRYLDTVQKSSGSDLSVRKWFEMQRPGIKLMGSNHLATAGGSSDQRVCLYDPAQVKWLVSIPFEQMPMQVNGFSFKFNCRARAGGVACTFPKSIVYADGI